MDEAAAQPSQVIPIDNRSNRAGSGSNDLVVSQPKAIGPRLLGRVKRIGIMFWLAVIVPSALALIYFGFLASDVYISESRYVVRSPEKPQKTGLGVLLGSAGFATASEEVRAAQGFIESRDALRGINGDGFAKAAWGNPDISIFDRFDPIGWSGSFEDLYQYYGGKVDAAYDAETGITTLTVRAFSPSESQTINVRLLEKAETLVNQLNSRGSEDLVTYAEEEVTEAKAQASAAAQELAAFRNRKGVIDPERQATVQLQMISKLQDELIGARLQLLQLTKAAPQNPQIPLLKVRIAGLQQAIKEELGTIAGDNDSLSETAAEYQRLQVQREFTDQQLGLSLASLQEARNEARRQGAYLERVAQPSLPDDALEPRRLRGFFATLLVGLVAWGILSMLLAGVREHRN